MAKAGAHGGTGQERQLDFASGRIGAMAAPSGVGGGETVAPATSRRERGPASSKSNSARIRVRINDDVDADALRQVLSVLGER